MIIYRVLNLITNKSYIGQTIKSLTARWKQHCRKSSGCRYLYKAIKKYGETNFYVEEIAWCSSQEELNYYEQYWVSYFSTQHPNGYNLTSGGGGISGYKFTEEAKKKMSESGKLTQARPEVKQRNSDSHKNNPQILELLKPYSDLNKGENHPFYGKHHTEESKKKNANAHKGLSPSLETRQKISESLNKPEVKAKQAEVGKYFNHIRWDVNRGIINPNCKFCMGAE